MNVFISHYTYRLLLQNYWHPYHSYRLKPLLVRLRSTPTTSHKIAETHLGSLSRTFPVPLYCIVCLVKRGYVWVNTTNALLRHFMNRRQGFKRRSEAQAESNKLDRANGCVSRAGNNADRN